MPVSTKTNSGMSNKLSASDSARKYSAEQYIADLQRISDLYDHMPQKEETWAKEVEKVNQMYMASSKTFKILGMDAENLKEAAKDMGNAFGSAFENAVLKGKGFGGVLQGLEKDIQQALFHNLVTNPLGKFIEGGIKMVTDKVFNFAWSSLLPGFASGGLVSGDRTILVGEQGPELFRPSSAGEIIPNNKLGLGGDNINIHMTVNTPDAGSFRANQGEILAELNRAMQRGQRNM